VWNTNSISNLLDHECNKRAMKLKVFGIKEQKYEDTLAIIKQVRVMVISNSHKYGILTKTPSLKGYVIFINEYLIPKDQAQLESWKKPFCRIKILLKKTSNQNLRKNVV
jgi:hypothetical protein